MFWIVVWFGISLTFKEEICPNSSPSFFHPQKCYFKMCRSTSRIRRKVKTGIEYTKLLIAGAELHGLKINSE